MIMESSRWSFGNNHSGRPLVDFIFMSMESPRWNSMESPRWNPAIIMEIGCASMFSTRRSATRRLHYHVHREPKRDLCHHHGDWPSINSFVQGCAAVFLPGQDHKEAKRELFHHHEDWLLVGFFISMPMESPKKSSSIITAFRRRTHLI